MRKDSTKSLFQSKADAYFFAGIAMLLVGFYPELFLAKAGSLTGDHAFQHYPWAYLLAEALHRFHLPFWTDFVHGGFPLVAEGQVGAFYPINLILYFFLPFRWAYSYGNCVHFLLAGWGMYFYLRKSKLAAVDAFIASVVYLFGAAYGGAYYNITSLKTLAWFPWMLFFFECFEQTRQKRDLLFLACCMAMALLAGYLQIAVLALLIFLIYASIRIFLFRIGQHSENNFSDRLKRSWLLLLTVAGSCLLALPQLYLTFQLAPLSNRVHLSEDYAYVGSMSPFVILTYVYPGLTSLFRGNNLYLGISTLFFILCAFSSKEVRKQPIVRSWIMVGVIAYLLAMGEWSPVYIALIKLTHFYGFRTPAKFLFFICFAGAVLSGYGFGVLRKANVSKRESNEINKAIFRFSRLISFILLLYAAGYLMFYWEISRRYAIQLGNWFVIHFIHDRAGHPHSLEVYQEKLFALVAYAKTMMALDRFWIYWTHLTLAAVLIAIYWLSKKKKVTSTWLQVMILLLFVDLYAISFFDIKRDFAKYETAAQTTKLVKRFERGEKTGRIHAFARSGDILPLAPSSNVFHGLSHTGMYSPFVLARYYETIGRLGGVDDSNTFFAPSPSFVLERLPLLNFINVSHLISSRPLNHPELKLLTQEENNIYLYRNTAPHARIHFVTNYQIFDEWASLKEKLMQPFFEPARLLLIEKKEEVKLLANKKRRKALKFTLQHEMIQEQVQKWTVQVNRDCFFVLSDTAYRGWSARVNGKPVPLLNAYGLFRAVQLPQAGVYEIEFDYTPYAFSLKKR